MSAKLMLTASAIALLLLSFSSLGLALENVALEKKGITIGCCVGEKGKCKEEAKEGEACLIQDNTERGPLELLTDGTWEEPWYINSIQGVRAWITLDLENVYSISEIVVYHCPWEGCGGRIYHENKTSVSITGKFEGEETVVFDSEKDGEYPEPVNEGHHIKLAPSVQGRYVRDESNGSSVNFFNHWMELEVYGEISTASVSPEGNLATTWGNVKTSY